MKQTVLATLALTKGAGGPTKTVGAFRDALQGKVLCFSSRSDLAEEPLAIEGSVDVASSELPLLKQMRHPSRASSQRARGYLENADMVSCHAYYRTHACWVNKHCRELGIPYWFVPHGILDPYVMESSALAKQFFNRFIGRRFLDESSGTIFSTRREMEKAREQFQLGGEDFIVYWPVDLPDISNREARRAAIRRKLGLADDARVLLYFGRVHPMKRPLELIRSFGRVAKGKPNYYLLFVGHHQIISHEETTQAARDAGVGDQVIFAGGVFGQEKFDYLLASDAYVSISWRENFNHTAAEAMSCGLPVVLSPGNDLCGDLIDLDAGWLLESLDDAVVEEALLAALETTEKTQQQMGERARKWVADNLSFETFKSKLMAARKQITGA